MSDLIERAGSSLDGVMGGLAGRFMVDEFARGACGTHARLRDHGGARRDLAGARGR